MLTTLGVLEEPLGNTRLHVARIVASLLYTSSASHAVVAQELCRLNTLNLLLVRHSAVFLTVTQYLCCLKHTCFKRVKFPLGKCMPFSGLVLQVHLE